MTTPEFIETFNVDKGHYESLILTVRKKLATTGQFAQDRPILPPQEEPPSKWFDIVLTTADTNCVKVACRGDNVYLVGFKSKDGKWWELGVEGQTTRLITGSTFLGFDGSYRSLIGNADNLVDVKIGQQEMQNAAATLSGYVASQSPDTTKQPLVVLIMMLCEGLRFLSMSNFIIKNWRTGGNISAEMKNQVTGWAAISKALRTWDKDPERKFPNLVPMGIHNAAQAKEVIALVLNVQPDALGVHVVGAEAALCADPVLYGRRLVEVLTVRVGSERAAAHVYGAITVADVSGAQYIYWRDAAKRVPQNGNQGIITLTGPIRAISGYGTVIINLDLKKEGKCCSENGESKAQIYWDGFGSNAEYDKLLSKTVNTKCGPTEVIYAVLSNAIEAIVQVKIINQCGADRTSIYGKVIARSDIFNIGSVLFNNESNENMTINSQQLVPLARSVVAVSLSSPLFIEADLYSAPDNKIAKDSVMFYPALAGEHMKYISGVNGRIEVKITWSNY